MSHTSLCKLFTDTNFYWWFEHFANGSLSTVTALPKALALYGTSTNANETPTNMANQTKLNGIEWVAVGLGRGRFS
jgi:hypothetical protein